MQEVEQTCACCSEKICLHAFTASRKTNCKFSQASCKPEKIQLSAVVARETVIVFVVVWFVACRGAVSLGGHVEPGDMILEVNGFSFGVISY